MMTKLGYFDD